MSCALCRGEIYPGDWYYRMEGAAVCEACLERFARRYFTGERRRAAGRGAADRDAV